MEKNHREVVGRLRLLELLEDEKFTLKRQRASVVGCTLLEFCDGDRMSMCPTAVKLLLGASGGWMPAVRFFIGPQAFDGVRRPEVSDRRRCFALLRPRVHCRLLLA